eukprot:4071160-Pleurochrysis_carterae.AAC.1
MAREAMGPEKLQQVVEFHRRERLRELKVAGRLPGRPLALSLSLSHARAPSLSCTLFLSHDRSATVCKVLNDIPLATHRLPINRSVISPLSPSSKFT